jgi:hypothetical protein
MTENPRVVGHCNECDCEVYADPETGEAYCEGCEE